MTHKITQTVTLTFAVAPLNSADHVNQNLTLQEALDELLELHQKYAAENPGPRADVLTAFEIDR